MLRDGRFHFSAARPSYRLVEAAEAAAQLRASSRRGPLRGPALPRLVFREPRIQRANLLEPAARLSARSISRPKGIAGLVVAVMAPSWPNHAHRLRRHHAQGDAPL